LSPEQLLGSVDVAGDVVIADLEAGIGTLTRMTPQSVDAVLVVVEATPKSLEVGERAADIAREKHLGRLVIVANRVRGDDDLARVRAVFSGDEVVAVPDDPRIVEADREGVAPLDLAPDAPAVQALTALAHRLDASP
jgi:CO dehydrogenase maturation factor